MAIRPELRDELLTLSPEERHELADELYESLVDEPRRNLRPRLAARNQWARLEAIRRNREFLATYPGACRA